MDAQVKRLAEQVRRLEREVASLRAPERLQHLFESYPPIGDPGTVSMLERGSGLVYLEPILLTHKMELRVLTIIGNTTAGGAWRCACAIYRAGNLRGFEDKATKQEARPRLRLRHVASLGQQTTAAEVLTAQEFHFRMGADVVLDPVDDVYFLALQMGNNSGRLYCPTNHSRARQMYVALEQPAFGEWPDDMTTREFSTSHPIYFRLRSAVGVRVSADAVGGGGGTSWGSGSGTTVTRGTATIDFGADSDLASVAVTGQTGILAGSHALARVRLEATADHSVDDILIDPVDVHVGDIVAGTGFTIYARPRDDGPRSGTYTVEWEWM